MAKLLSCVALLALIATFAGCSKPIDDMDRIPSIRLEGQRPDSIRISSNKDTLQLFLYFRDADADLGNNIDKDVFLHDTRPDGKDYSFAFPNIDDALRDTVNGLDGICRITVPPSFIPIDTARTRDTFRYDIYVQDRQNHKSNIITTGPIYIYR